MATLDISPSRVRPSRDRTITFIGTGTAWTTDAPTFTPSLAGVSAGAVTVASDTLATSTVTYGSGVGACVWTDSTTAATARQAVRSTMPTWFPGL